MLRREEWFPTNIWYYDTDIDNNPIREFCLAMELSNKGVVKSNRGGWQSNGVTNFDIPALEPLYKTLDNLLNQLEKEYKLEGSKFVPQSYWININRKYNFNNKHTHPGNILGVVYYVDSNDMDSKIKFHDPRLLKEHYDYLLPRKSPFAYTFVEYEPLPGRFIIFPAWLEHDVIPSSSEEPRISIAFNIGIEEC